MVWECGFFGKKVSSFLAYFFYLVSVIFSFLWFVFLGLFFVCFSFGWVRIFLGVCGVGFFVGDFFDG